MNKNKKDLTKFFLAGLLGIFVLILATNITKANDLVCQRYDTLKATYKNSTSRIYYLKTVWLRKNNKPAFDAYKAVYDTYQNSSQSTIDSLNSVTKNEFLQYQGYIGYRKYLDYRQKCHIDATKDTVTRPIAR